MNESEQDEKIQVVYDPECPACDLYCQLVRKSSLQSKERVSNPRTVELIDAREDSELMRRITELGLEIDEGMVVAIDDELHYGADAIHALTVAEQGGGFFAGMSSLLFARRRSARFLYPWLRRVRNLLLKLLGKRRINNLELPGRDKF